MRVDITSRARWILAASSVIAVFLISSASSARSIRVIRATTSTLATAADTGRRDSARTEKRADVDDMAGMDHEAMARDEMMGHSHGEEALHMRMTPSRTPTHADSARAAVIAAAVKRAIAKYDDPAAAEADGYRMFLPTVKHQKVYHYTSRQHAFAEAFRLDFAKPTSLLYRDGTDGRKHLLGAMYTAPARFDAAKLDERIPISIAAWHQHVNWCLPRGDRSRWLETENGKPRFGPESPIATRAACEAVNGTFHERIFNWMVHANVFAETPGEIWAH